MASTLLQDFACAKHCERRGRSGATPGDGMLAMALSSNVNCRARLSYRELVIALSMNVGRKVDA
jgi:hypothetical protein